MPDDAFKEVGVTILGEEWDASTAHERPDALLTTKPRPTARLDRTEISFSDRQATLRRLREAQAFTQSTSAKLRDADQPDASRLERRSHIRLPTLKRFAKATGSEIHPVVIFTDGNTVKLTVGEEQ